MFESLAIWLNQFTKGGFNYALRNDKGALQLANPIQKSACESAKLTYTLTRKYYL